MADRSQERAARRPIVKAKMENGNTLTLFIEWPNNNPYSLDEAIDSIQAREDVVPHSAWVEWIDG